MTWDQIFAWIIWPGLLALGVSIGGILYTPSTLIKPRFGGDALPIISTDVISRPLP